ncbi:MAG: PKD domain-containing protein [Actinomycetota bacterium]|nr:PKD domain-containing protein [Actinomycetota bacterium]
MIRRSGLGLALCLLLVCASGAQAKRPDGIIPDIPTGSSPPSWSVVHGSPLAHSASLPYRGGPVLHSNRTHVIFWAPGGSGLAYPPGYEALVERFLAGVAADSHKPTNVYSLSGQYADSSGPAAYASAYGGAVLDTDALPRRGCSEPPLTGPGWTLCVNDAQIQTEIAHVIGTDNLPTSDHDIYFLVMPEGLGACVAGGPDYCSLGGTTPAGTPLGSFCGYHSATSDGILYAVIPFNGVNGHCQSANPRPNSSTADPTISTISHEHNEMVTDPYASAWIDPYTSYENGDLCITAYSRELGGSGAGAWNEVIGGGHYFLQAEWSNWDQGCAGRTEPDTASFPAPAHPWAAQTLKFTARAHAAHGSIVAYNWFFGDRPTGRHRSASHTYRRGGSYRVVLRTTDNAGLWAYFARTLRVGKPVALRRGG